MVAVGDVCLGMGVLDSIRHFGPDFPFAPCSPILRQGDLVFGNLEMVLYDRGTQLRESRIDFKVPLPYGAGLGRAGFQVLSVANNHILDFGTPACQDTLKFLQKQGIQTVGCGRDLKEARKPAICMVRGQRVGFLAYSDDVGQSKGPHGPCVAPIKKKNLLEDIRALRQQVDLIIISLHADLEFVAYPAPWRVRLCRQLIEAGADLILQHHPHVPQGVERYRHGMIIYSLGSFVFPVAGNDYADHPWTDQSFILRVWMDRRGIASAEFLPVRINRFNQPVPLSDEDQRREFLRYLRQISLPLHRPDLLDRFWLQSCIAAFGTHWSWIKEVYWEKGWAGVVQCLEFLARTSENRRWLLGLLSGMARFGLRDGFRHK
ncbi:MAG: CapA family protein [bacterium]